MWGFRIAIGPFSRGNRREGTARSLVHWSLAITLNNDGVAARRVVGCEIACFTLAIRDRGRSGIRLGEYREAVTVLRLSRFDQTLNVTGEFTHTAIRSVVESAFCNARTSLVEPSHV